MNKELIYSVKNLIRSGKDSYSIKQILSLDNEAYKKCLKEIIKIEEYQKSQEILKANENNELIKIKTGNTKTFCFISDIHLGSIYDASDVLNDVYDECEKRCITAIFCTGDVIEGINSSIKYNDLLDYAINTLPQRKGIKLYSIGGNHETSLEMDMGVNILEDIAKCRNDFIYLGAEIANLSVNKLIIRLCHGTYEFNTSIQNRVGTIYSILEKSLVPDILALGHIHKGYEEKIESTEVLQVGTLSENILLKKSFYTMPERSFYFLTIRYDRYGNPIEYLPEKIILPSRDSEVLKRRIIKSKNGKGIKK